MKISIFWFLAVAVALYLLWAYRIEVNNAMTTARIAMGLQVGPRPVGGAT